MTSEREKKAVALSSLAAAVLLTGTKLTVGLSTPWRPRKPSCG